MQKTVTGMFPDHQTACRAAARLLTAGFRTDQVRVVDATTNDRHHFIAATTADARRAVILGIVCGAVVGAVAGALLGPSLGIAHAPLYGGLATALGGELMGLAIGRSTKSQVRDEMEHQVAAGSVIVSVTTDEAHGGSALALLAKEGSSSVVSTATSFTAAGLPTTPGA
jgi:outer membrane lipoprotein SlyB